jgi:hypothetical protein
VRWESKTVVLRYVSLLLVSFSLSLRDLLFLRFDLSFFFFFLREGDMVCDCTFWRLLSPGNMISMTLFRQVGLGGVRLRVVMDHLD